MLEQTISMFITEIAAIEAITQQALKKSTRFTLSSNNPLRKSENRLWMPALCLLAAKAAKNINTRVNQLAGLLHLFNYATYLQFSIAEEKEIISVKNNVQDPVLVGDMLYSKMCQDACRYELQQYLDFLTSLIARVHQELAQRDLKLKRNLNACEHELNLYAIVSEGACYLGSHAVVGNCRTTETLRVLGYKLGILKAVREKDLDFDLYQDCWYKAWSLAESLPSGPGQRLFRQVVQNLGGRGGQEQSVLLNKINA